MDLIAGTSATVLVSLTHRINPNNAMDSMKKYRMHQQEVMMGMSMGESDFSKPEVRESWTFPHMWRANLTGWRPHMRIGKDTDYSAWVEGMNSTHIQVCQKSLYSGFHHEGVTVNLFVIPDRCPVGYRFFKQGFCGKYMPTCTTVSQAAQNCQQEGAFLGAPEDCRDAVWMSHLSGQNDIHIALSDSTTQQQWGRAFGNPSVSTYFRWAANEPSSAADLDCAYQRGRSGDFHMYAQRCDECKTYVCVRPAPWLSCGFRNPDYCNNCGTCSKLAPHSFSCNCIPPYHGGRCETRSARADQ